MEKIDYFMTSATLVILAVSFIILAPLLMMAIESPIMKFLSIFGLVLIYILLIGILLRRMKNG